MTGNGNVHENSNGISDEDRRMALAVGSMPPFPHDIEASVLIAIAATTTVLGAVASFATWRGGAAFDRWRRRRIERGAATPPNAVHPTGGPAGLPSPPGETP